MSLAAGAVFSRSRPQPQVHLTLAPAEILADGYAATLLTIESPEAPRLSVAASSGVSIGRVTRAGDGAWQAKIRSGVTPGPVVIRAEANDAVPSEATLTLTPSYRDRHGDGMPDAVRLDSDADREAFQRWFTFLTEAQYFQAPAARPVEINDCAALVRYAFREALRKHDSGWVAEAKLPLAIGLEPVRKYQYPYTLLGPSLFRVKPGAFQAADLESGAFSQFADAKTLQTLNGYFVSRDIGRAQPGDLVFYRHESADMPFHTMVYLGSSQISNDGRRYLIYHTGPTGSDPGEIRRPAVEELSAHPNPSWRPLAGNPTFLGVYRLNILR